MNKRKRYRSKIKKARGVQNAMARGVENLNFKKS
jgi:hypothetical protein